MFVSDVSDFQFVGKVKPTFFIAKEEVYSIYFIQSKTALMVTFFYLSAKRNLISLSVNSMAKLSKTELG